MQLLLAIYNDTKNIMNLNEFMYTSFVNQLLTKNQWMLHNISCYLQIHVWLSDNWILRDWECQHKEFLIPVMLTQDPAPQESLELIFCKCKKGCGNNYGCKRADWYCSSTCGYWQIDSSCTNSTHTIPDENEYEDVNLIGDVNEDSGSLGNERKRLL